MSEMTSKTTSTDWLLADATRDPETITASWLPSGLTLIEGVDVREVAHVPKLNGVLTELFRVGWLPADVPVGHVFQVVMTVGAISAWHAHDYTTDRLFVTHGLARIVLYDARPESSTRGLVNELRFGAARPALVSIPPRVWHGVQNLGDTPATILNLADHPYDYAAPDHWRVPHDSPEIPFSWAK